MKVEKVSKNGPMVQNSQPLSPLDEEIGHEIKVLANVHTRGLEVQSELDINQAL